MHCILARGLASGSLRRVLSFGRQGPPTGVSPDPPTLSPPIIPRRKGPHLGCDTLNPGGDLVTKDPGTSSGLGASAPPGWCCCCGGGGGGGGDGGRYVCSGCQYKQAAIINRPRNNGTQQQAYGYMKAGTQAGRGAQCKGMKTDLPAAPRDAANSNLDTHHTSSHRVDGGPVCILPRLLRLESRKGTTRRLTHYRNNSLVQKSLKLEKKSELTCNS